MNNRYFNSLINFLNITIFTICLANCVNKNQTSIIANQQIDSKSFKADTLSARDLETLSLFSDTLNLKRFKNEIENFEKDDSLNPTRKTDIIFTGSSSIRKWKSLQNDMKGLKVLNRGFGGSTIPEAIYYSDILIFKHKPGKIVFYAGENDIANTKSDTLKVFNSFVYFQKLIKQKLPNAQLIFISIKLSPVRFKYWNTIKSTNKMIEKYCVYTPNCSFIDVNKLMVDSNMKVRNDLFVADSLHLNEKGYQIWTKIILKALNRNNSKVL